MRARGGLRLAVAALVLVVGGCAGAGPGSRGAGAEPPEGTTRAATSPQPDTPGKSASEASAVRVVVTGGITGARRVYEVARDGAAPESTRDDVPRILALAGSQAVRDFAGDHLPSRAVECCDLQVFEITITHADGSHTRIRTTQTRDLPRELDRMLALLSSR